MIPVTFLRPPTLQYLAIPVGRWHAEAFYYNVNDEDVINNQEVTDSGIYFANLNDPKRWGVVFGFRY